MAMDILKTGLRLAAAAAVALSLSLGGVALAAPGDGGSGGGSSSSSTAGPTLQDVNADIKAERWARAIEKLKLIIADEPRNADALNLMGYSLRKSGQLDRALQFYLKALTINPKHKGALEYLGELYVQTGQMAKAKETLARLEAICGTDCVEYEDLKEAIDG